MSTDHRPVPNRSAVIRRALLAALGLVALGGAALGARAGLERIRHDEFVVTDEPTTNITTADVRNLSETFTATGTLQYDGAIEVATSTGGTVLSIADNGSSLTNGDVVAIVDDRAIVWLDGEIPAWRALSTGDEGADVLQLETALAALGFDGDGDVTVDEEYTSATAAMVEDWQGSIGVEPTGRVEFGDVVFGGDRTRVASVAVAVGDVVTDGAPLIAIGADRRYALLTAAPGEAVTLAVGDPAAIELPDRSEITGKIAAIAEGSDTWQITVEFDGATTFPATDVTNVEMSWTDDIADGVITVPSSSLLRLDDGTYTVAVVGDDGATTATPVTIGVAVGTRVEIIGGLAAGASVISL